jgi:hypothetical protein
MEKSFGYFEESTQKKPFPKGKVPVLIAVI